MIGFPLHTSGTIVIRSVLIRNYDYAPSRLEGGFRLYSEDDVQRIEQIKRLQRLLGFTLADIKEMVEAEEVKSQLRAEYRRVLRGARGAARAAGRPYQ